MYCSSACDHLEQDWQKPIGSWEDSLCGFSFSWKLPKTRKFNYKIHQYHEIYGQKFWVLTYLNNTWSHIVLSFYWGENLNFPFWQSLGKQFSDLKESAWFDQICHFPSQHRASGSCSLTIVWMAPWALISAAPRPEHVAFSLICQNWLLQCSCFKLCSLLSFLNSKLGLSLNIARHAHPYGTPKMISTFPPCFLSHVSPSCLQLTLFF